MVFTHFCAFLLPSSLLSERRSLSVRPSRCVCVRHISLGGEGNALYPVLSSFSSANVILTYPFIVIFLDPKASLNATLVVLVLLFAVVISSLKMPKAFLICSGAQRNFAC